MTVFPIRFILLSNGIVIGGFHILESKNKENLGHTYIIILSPDSSRFIYLSTANRDMKSIRQLTSCAITKERRIMVSLTLDFRNKYIYSLFDENKHFIYVPCIHLKLVEESNMKSSIIYKLSSNRNVYKYARWPISDVFHAEQFKHIKDESNHINDHLNHMNQDTCHSYWLKFHSIESNCTVQLAPNGKYFKLNYLLLIKKGINKDIYMKHTSIIYNSINELPSTFPYFYPMKVLERAYQILHSKDNHSFLFSSYDLIESNDKDKDKDNKKNNKITYIISKLPINLTEKKEYTKNNSILWDKYLNISNIVRICMFPTLSLNGLHISTNNTLEYTINKIWNKYGLSHLIIPKFNHLNNINNIDQVKIQFHVEKDHSIICFDKNGFFSHFSPYLNNKSILYTIKTIPPRIDFLNNNKMIEKNRDYNLKEICNYLIQLMEYVVTEYKKINEIPCIKENPSNFEKAIDIIENQKNSVGIFTAFNDGQIRIVFADRTIICSKNSSSYLAKNRYYELTNSNGDTFNLFIDTPIDRYKKYILHALEFQQWAFKSKEERYLLIKNQLNRRNYIENTLDRTSKLLQKYERNIV